MKFLLGDVLADQSEALVNTVNCVGVMGRGVALQFKRMFPDNFVAYKKACDAGEVVPGRMHVFETGRLGNPKLIINFPTKRHWRGKSRIEDVEMGLDALRDVILERSIQSIAMPPLGSGLGGLDWKNVRNLIEDHLGALQGVEIKVYEPMNEPNPRKVSRSRKVPNMTPGRAALVGLIDRYLAGLAQPSASLLEVHKLLYFMQNAGEPLRLKYVKAPYGPYAENLRHLMHTVEGYFLSGYNDGGDEPTKEIAIVPGASDDAHKFLVNHPDTAERFGRVGKLVDGFESAFGLELLATVHWVATNTAEDRSDIAGAVYRWAPHKRKFSLDHIDLAMDRLVEEGWVMP